MSQEVKSEARHIYNFESDKPFVDFAWSFV